MKHSWLKNIITPYLLAYFDEVVKKKQIPFIVRGNLQWKPENSTINRNGYILKTGLLELNGKKLNEVDGVKYHLQFHENTYEIIGIKEFFTEESEKRNNVEKKLTESILEIQTFVNTVSLINDVSIRLLPARIIKFKRGDLEKEEITRIPRSTEEMMSTVVKTDNLIYCLGFANKIKEIPIELRKIIRRAIYWQSQGNNYENSLTRFTSHWLSIEILANYFFKAENSNFFKEINKRVIKMNKRNYKDIIKDCNKLIEPGIKEKINYMLNFFKEKNDFLKVLFEKDTECKLSPYEIRNKILHGSLTEYELEKIQQFDKIFYNMQKTSKKIIINIINNYKEILKQIYN